jgi:FtsX-like permease family
VVAGRGAAAGTGRVGTGQVGAAVTGGAVLKAASAGAARRLTQTLVIFVVLTMATTAALVGLTLASDPTLSFRAVSARYHTADLAVTIDATKVTGAQLARTHLSGVTEAVGYPATTVSITVPLPPKYRDEGPAGGTITAVGRASKSGPLDEIIETHGRWFTQLGEMDLNELSGRVAPLGLVITGTVTSLASKPKLTIVGTARLGGTQDDTQEAWALPGQIAALEQAGAPRQEQMLYTFSHASTVAQVSADLGELRAALPAGAIVGHSVALASAGQQTTSHGIQASSTLPYAVMALLLAAVIIASAAAAAVTAGYRRIGVLKSIGFTPAQIAATYLAQLGIPALPGAVAGTALGTLWALPYIQETPIFGVTVAIPVWITIAAPAAMLALTGLAALVPAVRAGRLSAVQAITAGQAPRAGHGHTAQRLAGRLPLPRAVTAGLAAPFTRPSRSAATLATITIGLTAAVLAVGLDSQITKIVISIGVAYIDRALFQKLTWLVVVLAGIGVFATLLMQARERVHDLGIHKALGMTPRQVITMVTCWAIAPAIIAAAIALPVGIALEPAVARAIVSAQAGPAESISPLLPGPPRGAGQAPRPGGPVRYTRPGAAARTTRPGRAVLNAPSQHQRLRGGQRPSGRASAVQGIFAPLRTNAGQTPYTARELALLALAGLVVAIIGALGPATWAAASRTTTALHTE